jgi:hypothetical protein
MKKLVLEEIRVDSFATGEAAEARGTVAAHSVEPAQVTDPISKSCVSDITWLAGPVCCALY